jgi:hypothetical protein
MVAILRDHQRNSKALEKDANVEKITNFNACYLNQNNWVGSAQIANHIFSGFYIFQTFGIKQTFGRSQKLND